MKINIKQTNLENTPALSEYIDRKMSSLEKLLKNIEKKSKAILHLEIARNTKHHKSGKVFSADAKLIIPGKTFYARQEDIDIRSAIDRLENKLKTEALKYKERLTQKRNKNV